MFFFLVKANNVLRKDNLYCDIVLSSIVVFHSVDRTLNLKFPQSKVFYNFYHFPFPIDF